MEASLWKSASTGCSELWQDFKSPSHHHQQLSCQGLSPKEQVTLVLTNLAEDGFLI